MRAWLLLGLLLCAGAERGGAGNQVPATDSGGSGTLRWAARRLPAFQKVAPPAEPPLHEPAAAETLSEAPQPSPLGPTPTAWRGCVGVLAPPRLCDPLLPSLGRLRLAPADVGLLREAACSASSYASAPADETAAYHGAHCGAELPLPVGAGLVDGALFLPPSFAGSVESWNGPEGYDEAPFFRWPQTKPTADRVSQALLVGPGPQSRLLYDAAGALPRGSVRRAMAALQTALHPERPPNILVVVLDGESACRTAHFAPRLHELLTGGGEGLEAFPLEGFHTVGEMTTLEQLTAALGGMRQPLHKSVGASQHPRVGGGRWIFDFLQRQGYVTVNTGAVLRGMTLQPRHYTEFDVLTPRGPANGLCCGHEPEPVAYLRWAEELAASVDVPVFTLVHLLQAHGAEGPERNSAFFGASLLHALPRLLLQSSRPTVALVMGDHGIGKVHDWPALSLLAAPQTWDLVARRAGRDVRASLAANRGQLTSHFDLYETLRELGTGAAPWPPVDDSARPFLPWAPAAPQSLLRPLPSAPPRSLDEVGISRYSYLLSSPGKALPSQDPELLAGVGEVLAEMRDYVAAHKPRGASCPRLELQRVLEAESVELDGTRVVKVRFSVTHADFEYRAELLMLGGASAVAPLGFPVREGEDKAFAATPVSRFGPNKKCAGRGAISKLCLCGV